VAEVDAAPVLAVGDDFEPDRLLETHRVPDVRILFGPERVMGQPALGRGLPGGQERRRAEQAADVLRAERGRARQATPPAGADRSSAGGSITRCPEAIRTLLR
jgi:hypothetical protein